MINRMKKVLYASDMEEGSRPALRAAVAVTGGHPAEISYLHVLASTHKDNMVLQTLLKDDDMRDMYRQSLTDLKQKLEQRIAGFLADESAQSPLPDALEVNSVIVEGTPWKAIVKQAAAMEADVIVMGTRTHSTLGSVILGSTATKVMQNAGRPVLIVPLD